MKRSKYPKLDAYPFDYSHMLAYYRDRSLFRAHHNEPYNNRKKYLKFLDKMLWHRVFIMRSVTDIDGNKLGPFRFVDRRVILYRNADDLVPTKVEYRKRSPLNKPEAHEFLMEIH